MKLSLLMLLIRAAGKNKYWRDYYWSLQEAEGCIAFSFGHSGVFVVLLPEAKHEDDNTTSGKK